MPRYLALCLSSLGLAAGLGIATGCPDQARPEEWRDKQHHTVEPPPEGARTIIRAPPIDHALPPDPGTPPPAKAAKAPEQHPAAVGAKASAPKATVKPGPAGSNLTKPGHSVPVHPPAKPAHHK